MLILTTLRKTGPATCSISLRLMVCLFHHAFPMVLPIGIGPYLLPPALIISLAPMIFPMPIAPLHCNTSPHTCLFIDTIFNITPSPNLVSKTKLNKLRATNFVPRPKWHLADTPRQRGFDRYFGFLNGAVNFSIFNLVNL